MDVCMVTPRYPPNIVGGGEISCKLLVDTLRAVGMNVDVYSADHLFPTSSATRTLIGMYGLLKSKLSAYDIFHTYNMDFLPVVGMLSKRHDAFTVGTLNGVVYSNAMTNNSFLKRIRNKLIMRSIKHVKRFTTLCPYYTLAWEKDGIASSKMTVIPNMIDLQFRVLKRVESDKTRILFVGHYAEWRNLASVVNMYKKLENATLTVVGSGWDSQFLKKVGVDYKDYVAYGDMPKIYANSDILVSTYKFPAPISRCIIEGMLHGLCVITNGTDEYSPIIQDNISGVLLEHNESLDNVASVFVDRDLCKQIGLQARRRVQEVCSPSTIIKQYIEIYKEKGSS